MEGYLLSMLINDLFDTAVEVFYPGVGKGLMYCDGWSQIERHQAPLGLKKELLHVYEV